MTGGGGRDGAAGQGQRGCARRGSAGNLAPGDSF